MIRHIPANELALAYELKRDGCYWKLIAEGLGYDLKTLQPAVYRAVRKGLR